MQLPGQYTNYTLAQDPIWNVKKKKSQTTVWLIPFSTSTIFMMISCRLFFSRSLKTLRTVSIGSALPCTRTPIPPGGILKEDLSHADVIYPGNSTLTASCHFTISVVYTNSLIHFFFHDLPNLMSSLKTRPVFPSCLGTHHVFLNCLN